MHVENIFCDAYINNLVAIVKYDKEQIETGHNGSRHSNILLEKLIIIVIYRIIYSKPKFLRLLTLNVNFLLYLPPIGFAAARIDVRAFREAWILAFASVIVCCSIASCIAT